MGVNQIGPSQAFRQGRSAALSGKPIYANPHTGVDAEAWRKGYLSVALCEWSDDRWQESREKVRG